MTSDLLSLPPEVRLIIWRYAIGDIGDRTVTTYSKSSNFAGTKYIKLYPNLRKSTLPRYLKILSQHGFEVPKPAALAKEYDSNVGPRLPLGSSMPQPGSCKDCGKPHDRPAAAELCWECSKSGLGILYACRLIFLEAVAVLYHLTLPTFPDTKSLIRYMYCVNSHNHGKLVTRMKLYVPAGFTKLYYRGYLFPPGTLSRALPNLKKLVVEFGALSTECGSSPTEYFDMNAWEPLRESIKVLTDSFKEYERLEVNVQGLWLHETERVAEKSIAGGEMVDYDYEDATARAYRHWEEMEYGESSSYAWVPDGNSDLDSNVTFA